MKTNNVAGAGGLSMYAILKLPPSEFGVRLRHITDIPWLRELNYQAMQNRSNVRQNMITDRINDVIKTAS